ncbi:MAG TPA: HIT family protein [Hyphomonas sp.]|nr:HIT family protein [Hyphomonas sp.]HRJ01527.1 HIT family protein [Hyphomonas sp.]
MTLHAPYDPNNIFAKILRGEMPCVKVFEDEVALAFMDVFPQTEGHVLVVPKSLEARNFLDLPEAFVGGYMLRVQKVARAVEAGLKPDGLRVIQFNGAPAGQTVFHLHFHIIPMRDGVAMGAHASGGMKSADELEPIAARIRAGF